MTQDIKYAIIGLLVLVFIILGLTGVGLIAYLYAPPIVAIIIISMCVCFLTILGIGIFG